MRGPSPNPFDASRSSSVAVSPERPGQSAASPPGAPTEAEIRRTRVALRPRARDLVELQRRAFAAGETRDLEQRVRLLSRLRLLLVDNEERLLAALAQDMSKPALEAYASDVGMVVAEVDLALDELRSWTRPRRVPTPLVHQLARSEVRPEPLGAVLIIGPWNYPFQLTLAPLVAALAAGNTAVIKPSELAPASSQLLARLVAQHFDPRHVAVFEGGVAATQALLAERFDHVFFTGSTRVGRIVMKAAAEHLTPVTLELGGKSPAIVHADAPVELSAKRIAWGKYFNAGQTCVAPDYVLVHESVAERFVEGLRQAISELYGAEPRSSPDYARIISAAHFDRLARMIRPELVAIGGEHDREQRYIAPTVLTGVTWDDVSMQDEIFGPVLPVLTYSDLDEVIDRVRSRPSPLALYVFTPDAAVSERVLTEIPFGGGCVNDTLVHLTNAALPFGGVGESGMGSYHGKAGFDTFSHAKSIMKRTLRFDVPLRYAPYDGKLPWVRRFV